MNRIRLYWFLQILGWGGFALLSIFLADLSQGVTSVQIWAFIVFAATNLISTHFLRYIIKTYNWFKLSIPQLLFQSFLAIIALSFVNIVAQILINIAFGTLNPAEDFKILVILANIFQASLLFALWFVMYFLVHFLDNYNTTLKYEAKINEIRLNHLKSQLNPHFIFNALNSVRALVDEDPIKAKTAITRISNMLRFSLMMDKKQTIEFGEELNTVKDYLELESIRFEERLKVVYHIEDESYSYKIPPMMLQTIVENGIKHGISNLVKGGEIEIKCREGLHDDLYIQVKNSGQLTHQPSLNFDDEQGHGLSNTVQRLKLIYGDKASFRIFNSGIQFVITEIKIPKQKVTFK
ncbi:histidine kinase [Algoriphagus sp. D3-2-R+10]|uniref:sensor histidine kinase n=1 Tax=Algoriphagus aurantiacus TaxID=3103948 RepID=UPI002B36FEC4|nr:histidine kinase [Algoriphagus sp. D3-2-R+10]MEB2774710.1 histidine kinase [Algoriphagus sp. D3-2-R+10]